MGAVARGIYIHLVPTPSELSVFPHLSGAKAS